MLGSCKLAFGKSGLDSVSDLVAASDIVNSLDELVVAGQFVNVVGEFLRSLGHDLAKHRGIAIDATACVDVHGIRLEDVVAVGDRLDRFRLLGTLVPLASLLAWLRHLGLDVDAAIVVDLDDFDGERIGLAGVCLAKLERVANLQLVHVDAVNLSLDLAFHPKGFLQV